MLKLFFLSIFACGEENKTNDDYEGDAAGECSDAADNDRDGDFDCDDEGCAGSPDCTDDTGETDSGDSDDTNDTEDTGDQSACSAGSGSSRCTRCLTSAPRTMSQRNQRRCPPSVQ